MPLSKSKINSYLKNLAIAVSVLVPGVGSQSAAQATTVPFTEDFTSNSANWLNFNGSALLDFNPSGGPDGSSYTSTVHNFQNDVEDDTPVLMRGTSSILGDSSGGAFFGDWITDQVGVFSAFVRHNAPQPLSFFSRFASPINFPGGTAIYFTPVVPNVWTELTVEITASNPQFVTFEDASFSEVFDDIENVQIGVSVPAEIAGVDQQFTFELDKVSVSMIPEPATLPMASFACCVAIGTLRRR